jgi:hypothetical protein
VRDGIAEQFIVKEKLQVEDLFVGEARIRSGRHADAAFVDERHAAASVMQGAGEIEGRGRERDTVLDWFRAPRAMATTTVCAP